MRPIGMQERERARVRHLLLVPDVSGGGCTAECVCVRVCADPSQVGERAHGCWRDLEMDSVTSFFFGNTTFGKKDRNATPGCTDQADPDAFTCQVADDARVMAVMMFGMETKGKKSAYRNKMIGAGTDTPLGELTVVFSPRGLEVPARGHRL